MSCVFFLADEFLIGTGFLLVLEFFAYIMRFWNFPSGILEIDQVNSQVFKLIQKKQLQIGPTDSDASGILWYFYAFLEAMVWKYRCILKLSPEREHLRKTDQTWITGAVARTQGMLNLHVSYWWSRRIGLWPWLLWGPYQHTIWQYQGLALASAFEFRWYELMWSCDSSCFCLLTWELQRVYLQLAQADQRLPKETYWILGPSLYCTYDVGDRDNCRN